MTDRQPVTGSAKILSHLSQSLSPFISTLPLIVTEKTIKSI
nr:MAG TPA: hypothetical protein [Caudoviricetes sp.]